MVFCSVLTDILRLGTQPLYDVNTDPRVKRVARNSYSPRNSQRLFSQRRDYLKILKEVSTILDNCITQSIASKTISKLDAKVSDNLWKFAFCFLLEKY